MPSRTFTGKVIADIIEVRFPFSGQVSAISKNVGDQVKKGQFLAKLDQKILQAELDRELADYEKTRAEFEIFVVRQGEPQNDIAKYEKTRIQAQLNSSVKAVELAKARLDQANLYSPVNGVVIDDGGNRPGLYITPASNSYRILDSDSLRFRIEIEIDDFASFSTEQPVTITIGDRQMTAKSVIPVFDGKKYFVDFIFTDPSGILPGQLGSFTPDSL